jgi:hypothetical protein
MGQESKKLLDSRRLKMGPIGCPETPVRNFHFLLRKSPEERSFQGCSFFKQYYFCITHVSTPTRNRTFETTRNSRRIVSPSWLRKIDREGTNINGYKRYSLHALPNLFIINFTILLCHRGGGTRWHSWLRHCATSWKVAGSIPGGVIGMFHWHNPSGRTKALGLTQPLTEMSARNISWGVKVVGA